MYLLRVEKNFDPTDIDALHGEYKDKPAEMSDHEWYANRDNWKGSNELIYWRKANAIHGWFIRTCANGVDDCTPVLVHSEQLPELYELCKKVLANHDLAEELLPSQAGFFFGPTDYDQWYFSDLEQTVQDLEKNVINNPDLRTGKYQVIYRASW
jgi:hypothetical protein